MLFKLFKPCDLCLDNNAQATMVAYKYIDEVHAHTLDRAIESLKVALLVIDGVRLSTGDIIKTEDMCYLIVEESVSDMSMCGIIHPEQKKMIVRMSNIANLLNQTT